MLSHYEIVALATQFVSEIRKADEATLDKVYQIVARRANDSDYAQTHEPFAGLTLALQAEMNLRAYEASDPVDEDGYTESERASFERPTGHIDSAKVNEE